MHLWTLEKWRGYYKYGDVRSGIRLRFDNNVDPDVKNACKDFCKWIRNNYYVPIRVPIYIKSSDKIKALDGEMVSATFFRPDSRMVEPYIRLSTGDYIELVQSRGKERALVAILASIAHEMTHYYQWINGIALTEIGIERQATQYAAYILDEYHEAQEREAGQGECTL